MKYRYTEWDSYITTDDGTEIDVTVRGYMIPASPMTRDYPGDPAEFEIVKIFGYDDELSEEDTARLKEEGFSFNESDC